MSKTQQPLSALEEYLPANTFTYVEAFLKQYKVILTITRERTSIYGNYQWTSRTGRHRISVNGNLNKYSFLITLLHELAHLVTFDTHGPRVMPHGAHWKHEYGVILSGFLSRRVFPADVEAELLKTVKNPAASSCTEESLLRVLRKYDRQKPGFCLVEDVPENGVFRLRNGKTFQRMKKARKRIICRDTHTNRLFYFSPVAEVELLTNEFPR